MEHLILGICGGTGSGKSTLANRIYNEFKDRAVIIQMDSFYADHHDLTYEERAQINYDHPDAFDMDIFIDAIKKLRRDTQLPFHSTILQPISGRTNG